MPARASEMHTKSLWARCRIVRRIVWGGCKDRGERKREKEKEREKEIKGGGRRERCKKRDNNKWLARKTNAWFTWEDRWSREKGCVFRVLSASLHQGVYNPTPCIFIFANRKLVAWHLSSNAFLGEDFHVAEDGDRVWRAWAREESLEESCLSLGKLVCWNNERNNAVTSSAITSCD